MKIEQLHEPAPVSLTPIQNRELKGRFKEDYLFLFGEPVMKKGVRTYYLITLTQVVSIIGSMMTSIAVGIKVFTDTGTARQY